MKDRRVKPDYRPEHDFRAQQKRGQVWADTLMAVVLIAFVVYLLSLMFLNAAIAQEPPCGGTCGDQQNTQYSQQHINIDQSREVVNNSVRTTDNSVTATGGAGGQSSATGGAGGQSVAEGGSVGSVSASDNSQTSMSTDNSSSFLSLSLSLVQASGCWGGVNAGGGEDNTAGFLGISWLNNDCWMDHLAAMTRDAEHNAELRCHSRRFRNAIGWDVPRRDRREHCVTEVMASNLALIEEQNQEMQDAVAVIENQCAASEEALARCNVAWREALSK